MRVRDQCRACGLGVHPAMVVCPWCTATRRELAHPALDGATPRRVRGEGRDARCGSCAAPVRSDWSACPWCATPFRWSVPRAMRAACALVAQAGAPALARRIHVRYSRVALSYVRDGEDRRVHLAARHLRGDAHTLGRWERLRRALGRDAFLAFDHPLHIPLHECGHVFEHYLATRGLLDHAAAEPLFGDLTTPYRIGAWPWARANLAARAHAAVSGYATTHPSEAFAETFAVAVFLRGRAPALAHWVARRGKPPAVYDALCWMADAVATFGGARPRALVARGTRASATLRVRACARW